MSCLLSTHGPNLLGTIIRPNNGEPVKGTELPHWVGCPHVQGEAEEVQPDVAHMLGNLGYTLVKAREQVIM